MTTSKIHATDSRKEGSKQFHPNEFHGVKFKAVSFRSHFAHRLCRGPFPLLGGVKNADHASKSCPIMPASKTNISDCRSEAFRQFHQPKLTATKTKIGQLWTGSVSWLASPITFPSPHPKHNKFYEVKFESASFGQFCPWHRSPSWGRRLIPSTTNFT